MSVSVQAKMWQLFEQLQDQGISLDPNSDSEWKLLRKLIVESLNECSRSTSVRVVDLISRELHGPPGPPVPAVPPPEHPFPRPSPLQS